MIFSPFLKRITKEDRMGFVWCFLAVLFFSPVCVAEDEYGFSGLEILVDGKHVEQWDPPWWGYLDESMELPTLDAGQHVLELRVSDRAATQYSLHTLDLEVFSPR